MIQYFENLRLNTDTLVYSPRDITSKQFQSLYSTSFHSKQSSVVKHETGYFSEQIKSLILIIKQILSVDNHDKPSDKANRYYWVF